MQELQGTGLFPDMPAGPGPLPGGGGAGAAGMPGAGLDFGALMGMLGGGAGGLGGFGAPAPPANPEQAYAAQLQQLQDMVGAAQGREGKPPWVCLVHRPWLSRASTECAGWLLSVVQQRPGTERRAFLTATCLPCSLRAAPRPTGLLRPRRQFARAGGLWRQCERGSGAPAVLHVKRLAACHACTGLPARKRRSSSFLGCLPRGCGVECS